MQNQETSSRFSRSPSAQQTMHLRKTADVLQQQFHRAQARRKMNVLASKIKGYYGKNNPTNYKQQFDFKQKWEIINTDQKQDDMLFQEFHPLAKILTALLMIINTLAIWLLTTKRYFNISTLPRASVLLIIAVILHFLQIVRKYLTARLKHDSGITLKYILRLTYCQIICFGYLIYISFAQLSHHPLEHFFQFFIDYLLWQKASRIYRRMRLTQLVLRYQNHLKIFDLLLNICIQAHIFAIFLYQASRVDPQNSWINTIPLQAIKGSLDHYVYSTYFATTTMLTIGYGDLTPKNPQEVLVVTLVQIIGVISFGYFLNQMGHTLSKMRQQKQNLQKDISGISHMAKFYNLQKHLSNRAKNYLITNQTSSHQLKPEDENKLLMKLNNQLRTQIANENSLSVIKSSTFLLCQWSKSFMQRIATNLQKRLVTPNEALDIPQINLYIIKKGEIDVIMNRQTSGRNKKIMKNITIVPGSGVKDNVYGYTRIFSNRIPRLQAYARSFVATYFISKDKFIQCAQANVKDWEYFHQIKCRIDQAPFCEQWQTPAICNTKQHYNPSRYYLIKKYNRNLNEAKNKRKGHVIRSTSKRVSLVSGLSIVNADSIQNLGQHTIQMDINHQKIGQTIKKLQSQNWIRSRGLIQVSIPTVPQISSQSGSDSSSSSEPFGYNMNQSMTGALQFFRYKSKTQGFEQADNKKAISDCFEANRNYTNFFPKHNTSIVLPKLQRANCYQRNLS